MLLPTALSQSFLPLISIPGPSSPFLFLFLPSFRSFMIYTLLWLFDCKSTSVVDFTVLLSVKKFCFILVFWVTIRPFSPLCHFSLRFHFSSIFILGFLLLPRDDTGNAKRQGKLQEKTSNNHSPVGKHKINWKDRDPFVAHYFTFWVTLHSYKT